MKTVSVQASVPYSVLIGNGILASCDQWIRPICGTGRIAIISDSNVFPIYGASLAEVLSAAGQEVYTYSFPAGEGSKNATTYVDILHFLSGIPLTRSDTLIALGGGVVGDVTGFAAATYLRGISYIQIPTTLLAMVDSSVGGKTAIDLPAGKNLVGAFYQPRLVLCDMDTLQSLPKDIFLDGCAEVIKYSILFDSKLFLHLAQFGPDFDREYVISRCVELKANIVREDEYDNGCRQLLNLGHTIGHGIEVQSGYTVSHGKAVAAGTAIIAKAAWKNGFCSSTVCRAIHSTLEAFKLPTQTEYSANELFCSALSDKKRQGNCLNLILPKEIGSCIISPTPINCLEALIESGL